jgi:hypothetical protein
MSEEIFEVGDIVYHNRTGDERVVARVSKTGMLAFGEPPFNSGSYVTPGTTHTTGGKRTRRRCSLRWLRFPTARKRYAERKRLSKKSAPASPGSLPNWRRWIRWDS